MALGTPNSQAISNLNNEINIGQELEALRVRIEHCTSQFQKLVLGLTYEAMGTKAVRPDGTLDNDPDSTPNHDHPFDPGLYSMITRLISANEAAGLNTLLNEIAKMLRGEPVSQQGQAPQLLAKLVGGEEDSAV